MAETDFKYELFFDLSPDLLCIAGFDGFFKKVNPAVAQTLGYSLDELYSRPINDFVFCADKRKTQQVRNELTRSVPLYNFENRYRTKAGEVVWLSWTSYPVPDKQLVFAIAKNVTHKKIQEADRSNLLTKLTHINNDLKQLTYTTSHDLRSPVNNVLAVLDLIELEKINDKEATELIKVLKLSGEYLKESMDNYIDALSEKHSQLAVREEVDLQDCLDHVIKSIASLIEVSRVSIETDFSQASKITFNKAYMSSVFLNLITNSIKYARPEIPPVIAISSKKAVSRTEVIFMDNGLGFDMEKVKDKLFGLHQKFHDHKDSKGIGLYLVYNHITSMGGQINVESKVNEGTKFIISLKN